MGRINCFLIILLCFFIQILDLEGKEESNYDMGSLLYNVQDGVLTPINKDFIKGKISLPISFNGKTITSIGEFSFSDCIDLESIEIPESVITIGAGAFSGCINLKSVFIPKSVRYIEDNAFLNCNSLTNIVIPDSVVFIGENAFPDGRRIYNENKKDFLGITYYNYLIEDEFVSKTVEDVIEIIGEPNGKTYFVIDLNWKPNSEMDPDYKKFFSTEQMAKGVEIYLFYWKLINRKIYVWATKEDEKYIIFSSVDYDSKHVKF